MSDYKMGFGFVIVFIEHLQILTTNIYSAVANSHILKFTTARTVFSVCYVFISCRPVTVSNVVKSSAFIFTPLLPDDYVTTN